ncbi:acyl-CoA dehydrogenase family protein [Nocardioides sp. Root190]|uniref:acyl-CoA dehydrogenase family protein n=1 Tax=Nocardioides sp. Root190 TaxID=1736488 RepID=UPI0012FB739B
MARSWHTTPGDMSHVRVLPLSVGLCRWLLTGRVPPGTTSSVPLAEGEKSMSRLCQTEGLNEDQVEILKAVRQFTDEQIIPAAQELEHADEYPTEIIEGLKELGVFGLTIPVPDRGTQRGPGRDPQGCSSVHRRADHSGCSGARARR